MSKVDWDIEKLTEFCLDAGLLIGIPQGEGDYTKGIILGTGEYLRSLPIDIEILVHESSK